MATWITKPWIEQALIARKEENLPKIARAQILELEATPIKTTAVISDKKLYVKALFSQVAVEQFKRDNPSLSMGEINGGLIFIKKYSLEARMENKSDGVEFLVKIDQFKFAGGEGNTQFGSNIIDGSTYPPLQARLQELWRLAQLKTLLHDEDLQSDANILSFEKIQNVLLENHNNVFIPEEMEKQLAELPEWMPSYRPPQTSVIQQSEITSCDSTTSSDRLHVQIQPSVSSVELEREQSETTRSAGYDHNTEERVVTGSIAATESSDKQADVSFPTKEDLAEIEIGSSFSMSKDGDQPSAIIADTLSQGEVLKDSGPSHFLEHVIKEEESHDGNPTFTSLQEKSDIAVISVDYVSSSQMSVVMTQPLRGLVPEEHCTSTHDSSQMKTNSDESCSILHERLSPVENSPVINVVPSSENSEETELGQALPNITPGRTAKQMNWSLTESQLENLLETSISVDDVISPSCYEIAPTTSQAEEGKITSCEIKQGNEPSSPNPLSLDCITVRQHCVVLSEHSIGKKLISERDTKEDGATVMERNFKSLENNKESVISDIPRKTLDFDTLFSQNTWSFSQALDKECSADLVEIDRRQSVKRKRSETEGLVHLTCSSDENKHKAQLKDRPVSPDSTSPSVKSSSHSGSSHDQLSNHSSSIYLAKPVELYSQQDPLVLDTSAESTESTDGVIDESGLLITGSSDDNVVEDKSPSIIQPSIEDPCTLTTPTFDSLPSFQVPAPKTATPLDGTPRKRDQQSNRKVFSRSTRRQEAETDQEPGTCRKKRKTRPRKFNWFSDAY